jgi:PIN domain nuclease of toxin-antitoxin system
MAIKVSLGRLKIKAGFNNLIDEINKHDFVILLISFEHTLELTSMDFHHRNPFDRLLIAQSIIEDLIIISADEIFDKYEIKRIW